MPFIATNESKEPIGFRDDSGKFIIAPESSHIIVGDQHKPAAESAGLSVDWVEDMAEVLTFSVGSVDDAGPVEDVIEVKPPKKRSATVKVREE